MMSTATQQKVDLTKSLFATKTLQFSTKDFTQKNRIKVKDYLKSVDLPKSECDELLTFLHKATIANVRKKQNASCSYSRVALAKLLKVSQRTISSCVKTLEEIHFIDVIRDKKRGRNTSTNIYILRYQDINKKLKTRFPESPEAIARLHDSMWCKNYPLTLLSKDNINNKLIHKYSKETVKKSDSDTQAALYKKCGTVDKRQLYKDKVVRARLSASQYVKAAQSLSSRIRMLQLYKDGLKITQFSSFEANRVSMKALEKEINQRSNKYFTFDTDYLSAVRFNTNLVNNELFDFKRFIEDTIDDLSTQLVKVKNIYNEVTKASYNLEDFKFKVCKEVTEKEFLERSASKQAKFIKRDRKPFMLHTVHNQTTDCLNTQTRAVNKQSVVQDSKADIANAMAEAMAALRKSGFGKKV